MKQHGQLSVRAKKLGDIPKCAEYKMSRCNMYNTKTHKQAPSIQWKLIFTKINTTKENSQENDENVFGAW